MKVRLARSVSRSAAVALLSLAVAGCPPPRVGAPCSLGGAGPSPSLDTATIDPNAPECAGRICLQPAAEKATTTGALCSADCSTDDDCGNAELTRDGADPRCKSGFSCAIITTVGALCCRKLCACRDFFSVPPGSAPVPAACKPNTGSACQNVR